MGRNFVIALLEYFDRIRFTERKGDYRRIRGLASKISVLESER